MLDKQGLSEEISVGVTYSSLMSAASLFFTGILISQYSSFNASIKVPLIFLILSTFSFIFSATIYTNAGAEITLNRLRIAQKYLIYAKNLVELLGLYLFMIATPLVIGATTNDSFLRITSIVVAMLSVWLYSQSKFSIFQRETTLSRKRYLSFLIVTLSTALYYFQSYSDHYAMAAYSLTAVVLVLVMVTTAYYFSTRSKQYKPTSFRSFEEEDAERLSDIIFSNLKKIKTKDYSSDYVKQVAERHSPGGLKMLAGEKQVVVAEFDGQIVGLAALGGNEISTVFTDPTLQRKGIGRMLIEYVEAEAKSAGSNRTEVTASKVDHGFYQRLGYKDVEQVDGGWLMVKDLRG